jgi:A/G-specific adenine glycosylase
LVSEIMLQQTQVDRVIPKYQQFLTQFPDLEALAAAQPAAVITAWQGLGYNRRGLNLQRAAQKVVAEYKGRIPSTTEELTSLPGIGPYTAAAIQAFAFNQPSLVIETNIRTVFIYHFFPNQSQVTDSELLPLISLALDRQNPRQWYAALMDYGSYLKRIFPNPTRRSNVYSKQSKLEGSNRQVRGLILKTLTTTNQLTYPELVESLGLEVNRVEPALQQLVKEGFVEYQAQQIVLKTK